MCVCVCVCVCACSNTESTPTERYRIQSDHFSAIAPLADELIGRLAVHWKNRAPPFCARCSDKPPLNEYFDIIDNHYKVWGCGLREEGRVEEG